eukprot:g7124.t1
MPASTVRTPNVLYCTSPDVQYNTFGVRTVDAGMADRRPICFYIPTTETETTTFAGTVETMASGATMSPCFTLNLGPDASPNGVYQTLTSNGNIDDWKLRMYDQGDICTQRGGENVIPRTSDVPKLDIGYNTEINQVTFKQGDPLAVPPLLPECYCYFSEGLLLVETNKMSLSNNEEYYTFHVTATHDDGRSGTDAVDVDIVDRPVRQVFLKEIKNDPDLAQLPLTSVYTDVVLEGTITPDPTFDGAQNFFRWEIFKKQSGGNIYVTVWKNETEIFTWDDPTIIEWDVTTTSRITFHLDPNSNERPLSTQLQKSTSYKIILHVTTVAQRVINTAPGPPIRGGFTVTPATYTFPDDLLTNADFPRIPHSTVVSYEFDAPQWRADSTGSSMDADLSYSFGFTPTTSSGESSATIWQTEDQSSTHFEISAHEVTFDGQDVLIANLKVCTVYKVCASSEVTMTMTFNVAASYEEIKFALLGDGTSAVDPQKVVAAQITADGIQNRLTADQYTELQNEFRDSVKRFDYAGMDPAQLGSALQATSSATASISAIDDVDAKNAEISSLLDATGAGLESFLLNPTADGASALVNVFSNVLAATGGQGDAAGTARRLQVIKLLAEYEDEFGEDILQSLEHAARREEAEAKRRLGGGDVVGETSSESDEVEEAEEFGRDGGMAEHHNVVHADKESENASKDDYTRIQESLQFTEEVLRNRKTSIIDLENASENELRELHATVANVLTPTEIASLFAGQGTSSSSEDFGQGTSSSGIISSQTRRVRSMTESGPSALSRGGNTLAQEMRIAEKYGRRYSKKEFEKRLRILKILDELHYEIPSSVADGAIFGQQVWEKFRTSVGRNIGPANYLVSEAQMLALERKERRLGEFGSPLKTHKPRRKTGENHEHPAPRQLVVGVGHQDSCSFCGVYHTPFALTDAQSGRFEPYSAYAEKDMKYLQEKKVLGLDGSVRNAVYTLTWNRTHSVYQIVDAKRRKIVAQTSNTIATRDGRRVRILSGAEDLAGGGSSSTTVGEGGGDGEPRAGGSSSSFASALTSIFGQKPAAAGKSEKATSARSLSSSSPFGTSNSDTAPLLLRQPEALEWVPEFVKLRSVPPVIRDCPSAFCDDVGLICFTESTRAKSVGGSVWGKEHMRWQCCGEKNPETLCNQPPCWFAQKCPLPMEEVRAAFETKQKSALRKLRADVVRQRENRRRQEFRSTTSQSTSSSLDRVLSNRERRMRRLEDAIFAQEYREQQFAGTRSKNSHGAGNNWFQRWMRDEFLRNTTVGRMAVRYGWTEENSVFSFADRARAYELFGDESATRHRNLQMAGALQVESSVTELGTIAFVEKHELPLLADARRVNLQIKGSTHFPGHPWGSGPLPCRVNAVFRPSKQKDVTLATALLSDAKQEIRYQSLDPATAQQQRHEHSLQIEAERVRNMNTRRSISQALTRVSIMRDRLVRGLIPGLVTNARNPLPFNTDQFSMDVGKVTNMSAVSTAFQLRGGSTHFPGHWSAGGGLVVVRLVVGLV